MTHSRATKETSPNSIHPVLFILGGLLISKSRPLPYQKQGKPTSIIRLLFSSASSARLEQRGMWGRCFSFSIKLGSTAGFYREALLLWYLVGCWLSLLADAGKETTIIIREENARCSLLLDCSGCSVSLLFYISLRSHWPKSFLRPQSECHTMKMDTKSSMAFLQACVEATQAGLKFTIEISWSKFHSFYCKFEGILFEFLSCF